MQAAKRPGPKTAAVSSMSRRAPRRLGNRDGRHRRHRRVPRDLHAIYRFRLWPGAGRCALARRRADRHRHHARRPVLGASARRRRARPADQEDALYRRLRLHHRQLQQPRPDHLQFLRRPRHRGGRRHDERFAASAARQARPGRHRRRQAHPDLDLRDDGFHQRLCEPGADHHPARRLDDCRHQLLHHGDPALRQPDRIQADHARRFCAGAVRPVRAHRLPRREGARQRRFVRCENTGAGRDRRHRFDDLRPVHQRLQQSADHLRRADADPRIPGAARPVDLRAWHRQRPDRWRPAAWRGRRCRHRSRRGRFWRCGRRARGRRRWRHRCCRRCGGWRRAWRRFDRGCGHHGLSRRRHVRRRRGRRLRRDEPAPAGRGQHARKLRGRRQSRDRRRVGSRYAGRRRSRPKRRRPPAWARRMQRNQSISRGASAAHQAIRSGDHPSSGSGIDLSEGE